MEYVVKSVVVYLFMIGATKMEPIEVGFMLVLYVAPVLVLFAVLSGIADYMEGKE